MIPLPNNTPEPIEVPVSARRWLWVGFGLVVFIAFVYAGVFFAVGLIRKPVATSLDAIDTANIERVELLVINRPDGGADFSSGRTDTVTVPAADVVTILEPLLKANPVATARGIWMGKLIIYFKDARKLEVLLYSVNETGKGPMRYKIEEYQYEVDSVTPFLAAVDAIDLKLKVKK